MRMACSLTLGDKWISEFKSSLLYIASSRIARVCNRETPSQTNTRIEGAGEMAQLLSAYVLSSAPSTCIDPRASEASGFCRYLHCVLMPYAQKHKHTHNLKIIFFVIVVIKSQV